MNKVAIHAFNHSRLLPLEKALKMLYHSQVMTYAIIELAGRQFMVKEGDILEVTRQSELSCKTLFYKNEDTTKVGTPYVEDIFVDLERIEDRKDDKVVVARYKSKSRYRRKKGHRQPISVVKVTRIGTSSEQPKIAKRVKKEEVKEN